MISPHVNPVILHDLHAMQAHCTECVITVASEGRLLPVHCEVCDSDEITVTLFSFDSGLLVRLWLRQVLAVEGARA